jgi:hypothetical protein
MTRLSDTQLVILSAASQRNDGAVLPLPETLKLRGGAEQKVLAGLRKRGFVRVIETAGRPQRVVITSEGMAAIGVEPDDDAPEGATPAHPGATPAHPGAMSAEPGGQAAEGPVLATAADSAATPAKRRAEARVKPSKAAPAEKPTPRTGTKQALTIEMLKRPEGATVEQIAAATGWQRHTVRGAISGALKRKLGLTVEATRTREVGPNKTGAKASATVYRIPGPGTGTA